ncbi:hypothetical protein M0Q97_13175 [Candidatus Dojkabacteria bacterium]|jgi:hypothetical protein|nr:hypothetical protein [Candidatus Dojkabacteria bacterium]
MKAKIFAYQKVLKIINSCISIEQLKTAYNVIQNYKIYYNDGPFYNNLINKYKNKMFSLGKNVEENISYTEHLAKNVKAQNFIEEKIKMLKNKYPDMSFRYGYQDFNHIIDVLPLSEYESNGNYINDEIDIVLEFDNNFSETILFVSENSLTKLP